MNEANGAEVTIDTTYLQVRELAEMPSGEFKWVYSRIRGDSYMVSVNPADSFERETRYEEGMKYLQDKIAKAQKRNKTTTYKIVEVRTLRFVEDAVKYIS